ncbi:hypothetical protein GCM10007049_09250 [Echinicola pacifica]|uniref:Transmembrane protein n=1 Tax=Echinicola pacifica TaxID=346377 RepID=A0A918ULE9_9BACT|nr:hypothetical protein GCM10007049_09250 [Echinicola pacifica]
MKDLQGKVKEKQIQTFITYFIFLLNNTSIKLIKMHIIFRMQIFFQMIALHCKIIYISSSIDLYIFLLKKINRQLIKIL